MSAGPMGLGSEVGHDAQEPILREYLARCQAPEYLRAATTEVASRVGVALMHLECGQADRAAAPLDSALQAAIQVPAPWLARAYCLALAPRFDESPEASVRYALDRVQALAPAATDHRSHRAVVYGCLMSSMASLIRRSTVEADEARARESAAKRSAALALATGVVGGLIGVSSRSSLGKIAGYGLAGAGVATAIHQTGVAGDFERFAVSAYAVSAALAAASMPVMDEGEQLLHGAPADIVAFVRRSRAALRDAHAGVLVAEARLAAEFAGKFTGLMPQPWKVTDFRDHGSWYPELEEAAYVARVLRSDATGLGRMVQALAAQFEAAVPAFAKAVEMERDGKSFRAPLEFGSRLPEVVRQVKPSCRDFVAVCRSVEVLGRDLDAGLPTPDLPPLATDRDAPCTGPSPAPAVPTDVRAAAADASASVPVAPSNARSRLSDLTGLRDAGLITPEEFEAKRREILGTL